jgi:hypothetical protein
LSEDETDDKAALTPKKKVQYIAGGQHARTQLIETEVDKEEEEETAYCSRDRGGACTIQNS